MKNRVITISREYAAYGRTVAGYLSEKLGIPYFDKDFVKKTAEDSGFSEETIKEEGEMMSKGHKWINSIIHSSPGSFSSYDSLFVAQSKVILELAKEPCIIVGRCAGHVLTDAGIPCFNIFLYGTPESRRKRAAEEMAYHGITDTDVDKYIAKIDSQRRNYFKTYTGKEMRDASNYNICLDIGTLGLEKCEEILFTALSE